MNASRSLTVAVGEAQAVAHGGRVGQLVVAALQQLQVGGEVLGAGQDVTLLALVEDFPLEGQLLHGGADRREQLGAEGDVPVRRGGQQDRGEQVVDGEHASSP